MLRYLNIAIILGAPMVIMSCDFGANHDDLTSYISQVKSRPAGNIEALPSFKPYEPFTYSAAAIRSPFEPPVTIERKVFKGSNPNVKPDLNRVKEYLERFDVSALSMVGSLEQRGILRALILDELGVVTPVTKGMYIGKNHGRVVDTAEMKLDLIEIVSDGLGGWVERPRVLALSEKE